MDDPVIIYVYRYADGTTQLRVPGTDDRELVREALQEAILALDDGDPVEVN